MPCGLRSKPLLTALLVALAAPAPVRSVIAQRAGASIGGIVADSLGAPIAGAELGVKGSGLRATTDERGEFRITGLLPGRATLTARRLGYRAYAKAMYLNGGEDRVVSVRLVAIPELLSGVAVTAPREVYASRLDGFNARSQQQVGHFVTRERIDRANSATLSDLLREVPGVRIGPDRNQGRLIRLRGATCPPLVFIDGVPATAGEFDLDIVAPASVEGIEIYNGSASVPPEFMGPRDLDRCGVIAIWSRPMRARARVHEAGAADAAPADSAELFTRDEVEVQARLEEGALRATYPDSLFRLGRPGRVVVEFIVDAAGRVEEGSVDVLQSTDSLFTVAVRTALAKAQFIPAQQAGRPVRQILQLPFTFTVEPRRP